MRITKELIKEVHEAHVNNHRVELQDIYNQLHIILLNKDLNFGQRKLYNTLVAMLDGSFENNVILFRKAA